MMKKEITLSDIAGYATERAVWQMMLGLSDYCGIDKLNGITSHRIIIEGDTFLLKDSKTPDAGNGMAFAAPETFNKKEESNSEKADTWTLGALAFYAITGTDVFEGKGGETQTPDTKVMLKRRRTHFPLLGEKRKYKVKDKCCCKMQ